MHVRKTAGLSSFKKTPLKLGIQNPVYDLGSPEIKAF